MRRLEGEQDAVSRACASQAHPGRLEVPSGPYYGGSAAHAGWTRSVTRRGNPAGSWPGITDPRPKITAVARSQAPRSVVRRIASLSTTPAPVGALPPLMSG